MDEVTDDRGALGTAGTAGVETDEFSEAFSEATETGERADLTAADDPAKQKPEEVATETVVVEDAGTAGTAGIPDSSEQQPGESDEKYEQRYKTLQGIHKHDKQTWEEEKAQLLGQLEEAKKPKTPVGEPAKKEPTVEEIAAAEKFVDSLTDEQKQQLALYDEEFDTVSKMEGLRRNVALASLRKEILDWKKEIEGKLTKQDESLAPLRSRAEEDERTAHFTAIRQGYVAEDGTKISGHPDYQTHVDNGAVEEWIGTFPSYLQAGFKRVLAKGTAEEVIDLFNRFKEANNIPNLPSNNEINPVIHLSEKKAQRKAALAAVGGRRGAVNLTQADTTDFDGAFDEASKKAGG